jgi:hypothetical protein
LERNITIKLGYANAKIYKCPTCERPSCYRAYGSSKVWLGVPLFWGGGKNSLDVTSSSSSSSSSEGTSCYRAYGSSKMWLGLLFLTGGVGVKQWGILNKQRQHQHQQQQQQQQQQQGLPRRQSGRGF